MGSITSTRKTQSCPKCGKYFGVIAPKPNFICKHCSDCGPTATVQSIDSLGKVSRMAKSGAMCRRMDKANSQS